MPNVDWNQVLAETREMPRTVDPRQRLLVCFVLFLVAAGTILARAAWLEVREGDKRRELAARPLENHLVLPARRGPIVDRNGVVLAEDQTISALAVQYRYLETPPDERWLRSLVRARLTKEERKNPSRVEAEERKVLAELRETQKRLATLCGIDVAEWDRRAGRLQRDVERISRSVNLRQMEKYLERQQEKAKNPPSRFERFLSPEIEQKPEPIIVREELDYHILVEEVPAEVVELVTSQSDRFPGMKGMKIVERTRRVYPLGMTAAHLVGYMGSEEFESEEQKVRPDAPYGRKTGVERALDEALQGRPGEMLEKTDKSGRLLSVTTTREVRHGQTVMLTIDSRLQQTAEELLDQAILRRSYTGAKPEHVGGAAVVMDITSGEILAAATAPRFDPNWFIPSAEDRSEKIRQAMTGPGKPMLNRVTQMAIPPGSVFKIVTAVAALESGAVSPTSVYRCRGFMEKEDAYRCPTYTHHQEGHGPVQLADALAQSCNTYFFDAADKLGAKSILGWAVRLGLGQKTRVELPGESSGKLPPLVQVSDQPSYAPINARFVAIGQERLRTTPIQVARMMAVIANNGRLLRPRLVDPVTDDNKNRSQTTGLTGEFTDIPQLHPETISAIRTGLERTVTSPLGTAHDLDALGSEGEAEGGEKDAEAGKISIAGKTGTAQSGGNRSDHAWFAAYTPADKPRYIVVVALEHAGSGTESAVPVARLILIKMRQLDLI